MPVIYACCFASVMRKAVNCYPLNSIYGPTEEGFILYLYTEFEASNPQNVPRWKTLTEHGIACTDVENRPADCNASKAAASLYALRMLKAHGSDGHALWEVTQATLMAQLLYASSAWSGFVKSEQRTKLQLDIRTSYFLISEILFSDIGNECVSILDIQNNNTSISDIKK